MLKRLSKAKMTPLFERDRRFDEEEAIRRQQEVENARYLQEQSELISKHIAEHMPGVRANLDRFYETGEDQLLLLSEPHPLTVALTQAVIKETGAHLEDFDDSDSSDAVQEVEKFPIPADLQQELELEEPYIHANVWDSPMLKGGTLYKLDFLRAVPAGAGQWAQVHQQLLLASNMELNPLQPQDA